MCIANHKAQTRENERKKKNSCHRGRLGGVDGSEKDAGDICGRKSALWRDAC